MRTDDNELPPTDDDAPPAPEAVQADAGEAKTDRMPVETWAEAKGFLPRMVPRRARVGRHETTGQALNPKYAEFAAAKAMHGWPEGKELTEAEFDQAIHAANTVEVR